MNQFRVRASLTRGYFWPFGTTYKIKLVYLFLSCTLFSVCTVGGGHGNRDGSKCVFPFVHKGTTYDKCTDVESPGKPWCYTTLSRTFSGPYGYCSGYCLGGMFMYLKHFRELYLFSIDNTCGDCCTKKLPI